MAMKTSTQAIPDEATRQFSSITPLGLLVRLKKAGNKKQEEFNAQVTKIGGDPRIIEAAMGATTGLNKVTKAVPKGISIFRRLLNSFKSKPPVEKVVAPEISALTSAIKSAKPVRGEIGLAQTAERSKRIVEAAKVQSEIGGQAGYFAGLSKLKGELVKAPQFTPLSQSLTKTDIDSLFTLAQKNPQLSDFDKLNVQKGLTKLLDGNVPIPSELTLMEDVFGTDAIRAIFDKRPLGQKIWDGVGEVVADVPRALKTTLDMSATLRQGLVLGIKHPVRFAQSFKQSFKGMINKNAFEEALDTMKSTPEYRLANESGLHISDPRKLFGNKEEYFMSNLADKIPFIGKAVTASNRAYVGMLNNLRFTVFNDLASEFGKSGNANKEVLESLADFINTASGRGKLPKALERSSDAMSKIFFAPKFVMSRLQMFNPVWYAKMPAPVRKEAIKTLGSYVGAVTSMLTMAKLGDLDVETDWRSSNFGKVKKDNTYYDLTGGFGLYIRLFGQLVTNSKKTQKGKIEEFGGDQPYAETRLGVVERAVRSKLAPLFSGIANLAEGKNVVGEDVTLTSELLDQVTPLILSDMKDVFDERGVEGVFQTSIPSFFGVGVQTFSNSTSNKIKPRSTTTKGKKILPR
jgi:hypothetical protein